MVDPVITFEHVTKMIYNKKIIHDIHFQLPKGKIIGMVGPNGSGKSTILKLMAGLILPSKGNISLYGNHITRRSSQSIAYLPEKSGYYPFYTVRETISYHNRIYKDFNLEKATDMIKFMRLNANEKVSSLSKGHVSRLKIVLALSRQAPLILLDEPLTGLDPMMRASIIKGLIAFLDIPEQTIVITTHEVMEIEPLLDMVLAIRNGEIIKFDDLDNIRELAGGNLLDWMTNTYT
ncbi:ABC transporter ATP-binding protein [Shimazuella kribbensis]|uniref:ABC transporter ATP-binding protein n=1 Tax=Shimazuella kribbensis TaxID=139808 RepID=UPI00041B27D3|nr:ABC transporter ATP-binding protein [Shimazuella kribbensis]